MTLTDLKNGFDKDFFKSEFDKNYTLSNKYSIEEFVKQLIK